MRYTIDTANKTIKVLENVKLVDLILTLQASLEDWEQYTLVLNAEVVSTFDSIHRPLDAAPLWMYRDAFTTGTPIPPNVKTTSTSTTGSDFNL